MIELIKKALKSNALGRSVYPVLNKAYRLYSVPARRKRLQRSGYDVLKVIFEISEKESLALFPVYGSLLGFIRDKGFIKWDDDVDLWIKDLRSNGSPDINFFLIGNKGDLEDSRMISKEEGLQFQIIVVGKWNTFTEYNISDKVKDYFTFKYNIPYSELFDEVNNSDFIIINLDPLNLNDNAFKTTRVTGSAQLVYGFLKPAIINEKFASIYNLNSYNSFIYKNSNFKDIMRNAILQKNKYYQLMKDNLAKSADYIYKVSLENVNNCMNK